MHAYVPARSGPVSKRDILIKPPVRVRRVRKSRANLRAVPGLSVTVFSRFQTAVSARGSMSFSHLGLSEKVLAAVAATGYTTPTPIQEQAIPHVLARRDVLGIAQTRN